MRTQMFIMAALITVVPLAGCASITGGSTRSVNISSQPAGADITIHNSSGQTVFTGKTPTVVRLRPGAGYFQGANYTVTFKKTGYAPVERAIERGVNLWYLIGNGALVWSLGGLLGYLVIDPLTGAMWTLEKNCNAELTPGTTSSAADANSLKVVCLDSVPDHLRRHLRRVD